MIVPRTHPLLPELRALLKRITGAIPLHREKGVYVMKTWKRVGTASAKKKSPSAMEVDSASDATASAAAVASGGASLPAQAIGAWGGAQAPPMARQAWKEVG